MSRSIDWRNSASLPSAWGGAGVWGAGVGRGEHGGQDVEAGMRRNMAASKHSGWIGAEGFTGRRTANKAAAAPWPAAGQGGLLAAPGRRSPLRRWMSGLLDRVRLRVEGCDWRSKPSC